MNLRWGYNNIRIKEGDKWKAAFMTPERSFEPTVMFFGLINMPATFQAIINELLRNLINTGKVGSFINNIMVEIKTEEEHNELVAEVLKENNLYVKLEKCKWKVREVEFLEVSLLPPSCMVVPYRELRNITLSASTTHFTTNNIASSNDIDMVVNSLDNFFDIGDNFDEVRDHSLVLSTYKLRSPLLSLSDCKEEYHIRIKRKSDRMDEDSSIASADSIQIEYMTQEGQNDQVSKVADNTNNLCQQCISNEDLALNQPSRNNMFNIQLNYDINQALDPESWDGEFCAVSLHRSMEHLASDVKNIKDSLHRMHKYIMDKSINEGNANNVKDLEGIGKVVWEFILAFYDTH